MQKVFRLSRGSGFFHQRLRTPVKDASENLSVAEVGEQFAEKNNRARNCRTTSHSHGSWPGLAHVSRFQKNNAVAACRGCRRWCGTRVSPSSRFLRGLVATVGGASLAPCFSGWRKGVYSSTKSAELSSRRLPRRQAEACPTGLKRLKWVPHATGFRPGISIPGGDARKWLASGSASGVTPKFRGVGEPPPRNEFQGCST